MQTDMLVAGTMRTMGTLDDETLAELKNWLKQTLVPRFSEGSSEEAGRIKIGLVTFGATAGIY